LVVVVMLPPVRFHRLSAGAQSHGGLRLERVSSKNSTLLL
jgi:hypothetical protein